MRRNPWRRSSSSEPFDERIADAAVFAVALMVMFWVGDLMDQSMPWLIAALISFLVAAFLMLALGYAARKVLRRHRSS